MKYKQSFIILLSIILSFITINQGLSSNAKSPIKHKEARSLTTIGRKSERISLSAQDIYFKNPINSNSFWFEILSGKSIPENSKLILNYYTSPTLRTDAGFITVLLNDKPIASRHLVPATAIQWEIPLDTSDFQQGFNEIRIESRQRSILGRCRDMENAANWVKISKKSCLVISNAPKQKYSLNTWPYPFLNTISSNVVNCKFILPRNFRSAEIESALELASAWGAQNQDKKLWIPVEIGTNSSAGNSIIFREDSAISRLRDVGSIKLQILGGNACLYACGNSDIGIQKTTEVLRDGKVFSTLNTDQFLFRNAPDFPKIHPGSRRGIFTLDDVGYNSISIEGAFNQKKTIVISRPPLASLGKQSILNLKFKHSPALDAKLSLLTVTINGRRVAATRLNDSNATNGSLSFRIPISALFDPVWVIDLNCYHVIRNAECDKRYNDIAWTVIDGETSTCKLMSGSIKTDPYLDRFPYLRSKDGVFRNPVTLWLPSKPSTQQIQTAINLAARAGQINGTAIQWHFVTGDLSKIHPDGMVILVLDSKNAALLHSISKKLPVPFDENGNANFNGSIPLVQDSLSNSVLVQASSSPWDSNGIIYSIVSSDDQALKAFNRVIAVPPSCEKLSGIVSLIRSDGEVFSFNPFTPARKKEFLEHEENRLTPAMFLIIAAIAAILITYSAKLYSLLRYGKKFTRGE